jgi:O-antigen/teichoic acid export membrane protein
VSEAGLRSRVGKQAVIYGLGVVAARALSFVSLPIMTRLLEPADYGVIQLIQMSFDMLAILAGARIGAGVYRFYHKVDDVEEKRAILSTALLFLGASFSAMALVAWLSAEHISVLVFENRAYTSAVRVAALSFPWTGIMGVTLGYLRLKDKALHWVTVGLVKSLIQLVLVVILLGFYGMGVLGVFVASLVADVVVGSWLVRNMLRETGLTFAADAARDLVRFGLPLVVTQLATFFSTFADRYFLQRSAGESAVGIYALAYTFGFLLVQVGYLPFSQVWGPLRFEVARRDDPGPTIARAFVLINVFFLSAAVALGLFTEDLLRILSPPSYWGAAGLVPIILMAYVFQAWGGFLNLGIMVSEKTRYVTYADWTGAIIAGIGYLFLIPIYGGLAAAWSTAVAFGIRTLMIYHFSQRLWYVAYDWAPVVRLAALAAITVGIGILLPDLSLVPSILVRSGIMAAYGAVVWNAGIIPSDEREMVRGWARNPRAAIRAYLGR